MLGFEQVAHSQFLDSELYELCKQYPYNSRCKDIKELPLSLDDRSDETISNCAFMVRANHRKRPTVQIVIPANQIFSGVMPENASTFTP